MGVSNRCKSINLTIFIVNIVLYVVCTGALYWFAYRTVNKQNIITIHQILPTVNVDYSPMRFPIIFCFIASGTALFFGMIHVAIMRPFSAFSYILIAVGASGIVIHNAKPIESHDFKIMANYDTICKSQDSQIQ